MAADPGLIEWVREALEPIGTVSKRAMMGGATLYLDGTVFAIVLAGDLWFKADGESDPVWDAAGCVRFTYQAADRVATMNYRAAPGDVYDDPDAMREWATLAIAAGLRAPARKSKKRG